jgi:hypothetical protein
MAVERFERNLALHAVALNHGRPQEALAITERLRDEQPDPDYYLRLRILDGLYADGDTVAAARAADELAQITAVRRGADQSVDIARRMNRCVLDQWLSTTGAAVVGSSAPRSGGVATSAVVICEAAAHALREVTAGTRYAGPATARFDSLLVAGPFDLPVGDGSIEYANSALARAWEIAGEPDRALAAIGRRLYFLGWQASLAASLRHEARLAEQQGDTQRARIATQHYNALRYDPEPGLHAELRGRERR